MREDQETHRTPKVKIGDIWWILYKEDHLGLRGNEDERLKKGTYPYSRIRIGQVGDKIKSIEEVSVDSENYYTLKEEVLCNY